MLYLYPEFKGKKLIPTKRGAKEMVEIGIDMWDVTDILTNGYDCSRSKRSRTKVERCMPFGRKIIRTVVVQGIFDPIGEAEEVYYIIHASQESINLDRLPGKGGRNQ